MGDGQKRAVGFWVLVGIGVISLVFLLLGQTMSLINYDFTVAMGLQESASVITQLGVAINKGFGAGDTIIYIPLLITGLIGLWLRRAWGLYAMIATLGITAYWPMTSLFILLFAKGVSGFNFTNYVSYTIILTFFTIYGIWGIWYLYRNRNLLTQDNI